jgi:hypothetical protein
MVLGLLAGSATACELIAGIHPVTFGVGGAGGAETKHAASGSTSASSGSGGSCTVRGFEAIEYVTAQMENPEWPDLTSAEVTAFVGPNFTPVTGMGADAGAFSLPGVRVGAPYYLRLVEPGTPAGTPPSYYVTSSCSVDMSRAMAGRADVEHITKATPVTVNVQFSVSMNPPAVWADGDGLFLAAPGVGIAEIDLVKASMNAGLPPPSPGDQGYVAKFDAKNVFQPPNLVDSKTPHSDHVYVYLRQQSGQISMIVRGSNITGVTMTDGQPCTIDVQGLAPWQMTSMASPDIATWAFETMAHDVNMNATIEERRFSVRELPGTKSDGYTTWYDFLAYEIPNVPIFKATLAYGSGLTTAGLRTVEAFETRYAVPLAVAGAAPTNLYVEATYSADQGIFEAPQQQPVSPFVNPVGWLKVDGADASCGGALESTTPTLSWNPPSPPAQRYQVEVYHLTNVAGSTDVVLAGTVSGKGTTLRIPPGIIGPDDSYVFVVIAQVFPMTQGLDPDATPRALPLPQAFAPAVTGVFVAPH